ncbi:hypothetical protein BDB00DRAFT_904995 [Zychaea mexicana]|uniref:uncharacterized protein n=1 Tax=Zychaea mexicana TaxID=64656 RepID=UPI0022FE4EBF|nr:uncharacterized protein BDB00DRAFT_904995 [Zychaea mexicana]KAI9466422.1 hypothetical protein BDB00DRAFT_904995 [Zychaea mexicana]
MPTLFLFGAFVLQLCSSSGGQRSHATHWCDQCRVTNQGGFATVKYHATRSTPHAHIQLLRRTVVVDPVQVPQWYFDLVLESRRSGVPLSGVCSLADLQSGRVVRPTVMPLGHTIGGLSAGGSSGGSSGGGSVAGGGSVVALGGLRRSARVWDQGGQRRPLLDSESAASADRYELEFDESDYQLAIDELPGVATICSPGLEERNASRGETPPSLLVAVTSLEAPVINTDTSSSSGPSVGGLVGSGSGSGPHPLQNNPEGSVVVETPPHNEGGGLRVRGGLVSLVLPALPDGRSPVLREEANGALVVNFL